jgi:O-methyltransferase
MRHIRRYPPARLRPLIRAVMRRQPAAKNGKTFEKAPFRRTFASVSAPNARHRTPATEENCGMAPVNEWSLFREVPVLFARMGMMLGKYWDSQSRRERVRFLLSVRSERDMLLLPCEACQIMSLLESIKNIPGDLAEVGVASGASAKMIACRAPQKLLHLFDTFEGLPDPSREDSSRFRKGQYRYPIDDVQKYLGGCDNVRFHKGMFPESAADLEDSRFAFVHLDCDLYSSTKAGLEWFYPRLNRGGILVCHDYDTSAGVNQAFQEFFADKREPFFDLVGSQCMFVKL